MASETDFLEMYRTLGLRPGCALPELKQAFRRHVARLHPDRAGDTSASPATAAQLQKLIAQYDAAMDFQREHGRLPGSTTRVRFAVPEGAAQPLRTATPRHARPLWRHPVFALLAPAIVLTVLGWDLLNRPAAVTTPVSDNDTREEAQPLGTVPAAPVISRGLSRDEVRGLLGDPLNVQGDRWEYGPSWVRFEDDQVVDWYSSPLHSLGATARTPDTSPAMPQDSDH